MGDHYDNQVLLVKAAWGGKSLAVDFPDYNGLGYEIVGFGWHQGWNDRVNQTQLPETPIVSEVETVAVTLSPGLLGAPELFVQVRAAD